MSKSPRYGYEVVNARNDLTIGLPRGPVPVEWRISRGLVDYAAALAVMDARAAAVADGSASELVWLIERPPLYTAGTSAKPEELIEARFPVHPTGRGGQLNHILARGFRGNGRVKLVPECGTFIPERIEVREVGGRHYIGFVPAAAVSCLIG